MSGSFDSPEAQARLPRPVTAAPNRFLSAATPHGLARDYRLHAWRMLGACYWLVIRCEIAVSPRFIRPPFAPPRIRELIFYQDLLAINDLRS
jgi:hypothetical protein